MSESVERITPVDANYPEQLMGVASIRAGLSSTGAE